MAFDSAIISYTTKTDKVDLVQAAHINAVQSELVTIETILGTGVKGDRANVKTRLNNALDADGSILSGTSYPSPALGSQVFYRTDLTTLYVHNISTGQWDALGGSLSNIIAFFQGQDSSSTSANGIYKGTSNVPTTAFDNLFYALFASGSNSYLNIVPTFKWKKITGVSTVTVLIRGWGKMSPGTGAKFKVTIGSANGASSSFSSSSPAWQTAFTVDVTGLTNGSTYDVDILGSYDNAAGANYDYLYLSSFILLGS